MANHTSPPPYCGWCHAPRTPGCFIPIHPDARCEAGGPTHHAYAALIVDWVQRTGRDDVEHHAILVCDHPVCLGSAESFAHLNGQLLDTRALTAADVAEHVGVELVTA